MIARPESVATLTIMGMCTCIIGLLPNYDAIGVWAPVFLIAMRFLPRLGCGRGMGRGSVARCRVRARTPSRLLWFVSAVRCAAGADHLDLRVQACREPAGCRFPVLGMAHSLSAQHRPGRDWLFIRLRVGESPAFATLKAEDNVAKAPLIELLRRQGREVLLAVGTRFVTDITFNVINVFVLAYATQQLGLPRGLLLNAIMVAKPWRS